MISIFGVGNVEAPTYLIQYQSPLEWHITEPRNIAYGGTGPKRGVGAILQIGQVGTTWPMRLHSGSAVGTQFLLARLLHGSVNTARFLCRSTKYKKK